MAMCESPVRRAARLGPAMRSSATRRAAPAGPRPPRDGRGLPTGPAPGARSLRADRRKAAGGARAAASCRPALDRRRRRRRAARPARAARRGPQLVPPTARAAPLALHARGPRRAAARDRAHRVQRDQPGARRGLALRRHARRLLPRLAARGRARRRCTSALLREHLRVARPATTATSTPTTACGRCARRTRRRRRSRAWRWCRARWRRAASTRRRRCRPSCAARRRRRAAVEILDIILRDEVGHVAIGNRWYRWLCDRDGLDPIAHYAAARRRATTRRGCGRRSTSRRARRAGFSDAEIDALLARPAEPAAVHDAGHVLASPPSHG